MKNIKKLLSIVMVLAMVLSLGVSALAVNVTIDEAKDGKVHTYTAYQIFSGTQNEGSGNELAMVEWGKDIDGPGFLTALQSDETLASYFDETPSVTGPASLGTPHKVTSAADVAACLSILNEADNADILRAFGRLALEHMKGSGTSSDTGAFTGLDKGYYLFADTTSDDILGEPGAEGSGVRNDLILQVTEDVHVQFKNDVPSSEKKVDSNPAPEAFKWEDGADYNINDVVDFRLQANLHDLERYMDGYFVEFQDKISAGLTYNEDSYEVWLGERGAEGSKDISTSFTFTTSAVEGGGNLLKWTCENVKGIEGIGNNPVIYVYYKATVNSSAVKGVEGNPNTLTLEFSRDPNSEDHGKTPEDKVTVFTFKLDVEKVDGTDHKGLTGAGFTLLKKVDAADEGKYTDEDVVKGATWQQLGGLDQGTYVEYNGVTYKVAFAQEIIDKLDEDGNAIFEFDGLRQGEYLLVETTVPAGYNRADDITITVTATYEAESKDPKLTDLKVTPEEIKFTTNITEGSVNGTVVNQSGLELPETGGIGTTIFYIVGAILVAGAVILLVTKRRVNGAEK